VSLKALFIVEEAVERKPLRNPRVVEVALPHERADQGKAKEEPEPPVAESTPPVKVRFEPIPTVFNLSEPSPYRIPEGESSTRTTLFRRKLCMSRYRQ